MLKASNKFYSKEEQLTKGIINFNEKIKIPQIANFSLNCIKAKTSKADFYLENFHSILIQSWTA